MTLRALLLDFDGVLADTEPIHLASFQQVLGKEGIALAREEYYQKYLGLDDRACFQTIFEDRRIPLDSTKKEKLIRAKHEEVLRQVSKGSVLLPGAADFVRKAAGAYFLTVVSGALKGEVLAVLAGAGLARQFQVVVAADDVAEGKPSPEGFLTAIRLLNRDWVPAAEILLPQECLVIEDSPWGIEAARKAQLRCAALLTSYPVEKLSGAEWHFRTLADFDWTRVRRGFEGG